MENGEWEGAAKNTIFLAAKKCLKGSPFMPARFLFSFSFASHYFSA
jgi:hypothetical protein